MRVEHDAGVCPGSCASSRPTSKDVAVNMSRQPAASRRAGGSGQQGLGLGPNGCYALRPVACAEPPPAEHQLAATYTATWGALQRPLHSLPSCPGSDAPTQAAPGLRSPRQASGGSGQRRRRRCAHDVLAFLRCQQEPRRKALAWKLQEARAPRLCQHSVSSASTEKAM